MHEEQPNTGGLAVQEDPTCTNDGGDLRHDELARLLVILYPAAFGAGLRRDGADRAPRQPTAWHGTAPRNRADVSPTDRHSALSRGSRRRLPTSLDLGVLRPHRPGLGV